MKIYLRCSTCNFQIFVKSAPGDEITPVLKFDVWNKKNFWYKFIWAQKFPFNFYLT